MEFATHRLPISARHRSIPRRDLVLGGADNVLEVAIIIGTTRHLSGARRVFGGIGGPVLTLFIWPSAAGGSGTSDAVHDTGSPLVGRGTRNGCGPGTFDIVFHAAPWRRGRAAASGRCN
jgi:hypothetical protein